MTKKLIVLDASALARSACLLKLYRTVVEGYKYPISNNDIEFGTAFHKFAAHLRKTGEYGEALMLATAHFQNTPFQVKWNKKYLTINFLHTICNEYAATYRNDPFTKITVGGEDCVELQFCFPFYIDEAVEVLIAGTMDELGLYKGMITVKDIKTTSVWKVDEYFKHYHLAPQMLMYTWALYKYSEHSEPVKELLDKYAVATMIDGVFYKGADKPVDYIRSDPFIFKAPQLKEFEALLQRKVLELVHFVKQGVPPLREGMLNGACNSVYGMCEFFDICNQGDKETMDVLLSSKFTQKDYNPLNHQQ